jgi:hypothetical protein
MSQHCSQPISWLVLEQFVLGELEDHKTHATRGHLAGCDVCQRALKSIETDDVVLPGLVLPPKRVRAVKPRAWFVWGTGLVLAAAILLVLVFSRSQRLPDNRIALKGGGEMVVKLIRARADMIDIDAGSFRDGDRMKLAVTCTVPGEVTLEVAVVQGGETHYPLGARVTAWCGNDVVLPGAFEVSGSEPIRVCVTVVGEPEPACMTVRAETP